LVDREATRATARLVFQKVALIRLFLHQLAGSGYAETLFGTTMGLILWHVFLLPVFACLG
jgi:hypothetical protein